MRRWIIGFLLIDHSQGQGIDEKAGRKNEFETCPCKHCGAVIAILFRPLGQRCFISSADVERTAAVAKDLQEEYVGPRRCCRCKGNLCRACFAQQPVCVTVQERRDLVHEIINRVRRGDDLDAILKGD